MNRGRIVLFLTLGALAAAAQSPESALRKSIVDTALSFRGVPYIYGAASPAAFDCSGFVRYVYRKAIGFELPRTSRALFSAGVPVRPEKAEPGDILVFDTVGGTPSHVAIVVGDGSMIHAASSGPRTGVIVSPLDDRYFAPRLIGARAFLAAAGKPAAPPPAKPAAPPPAKPAAGKAPPADDEPVVSTVGFSITNEAAFYADKIPAAVGTAVQFAVTNATGRDGVFELLFYQMDQDPSQAKTLRRDRVRIRAGGMAETEPILFSEPGQYKLILKTHDNLKRVERVWRVVELK